MPRLSPGRKMVRHKRAEMRVQIPESVMLPAREYARICGGGEADLKMRIEAVNSFKQAVDAALRAEFERGYHQAIADYDAAREKER